MSKITNLIGTTWLIDSTRIGGIPQGYGAFDVLSSGTIQLGENSMTCHTVSFMAGIYFHDGSTIDLQDCITFVHNELSVGEDVITGEFSTPFLYDSVTFMSYEFTITGGSDISNPLFIDFINTYGTLVSAPEPEVPPTAESVKAKLQSLLTASNAKTGKSDANLTDAVNTLLEGYGQGETPSGSLDITENGTFDVTDKASVNVNVADNPLPIEIATEAEMTALLSTAEVGAIYKYTGETTDTYENGALYVVEESE